MAKVWELIDKAYMLSNAGYMHQARSIVNRIIARDPQNVEAWDICINTYDSVSDLEDLKRAVKAIWASRVRGKDYLNANRRYILRRINQRIGKL